MKNLTTGFIGAGNMAEALCAGLIAHGHRPEAITLTDINTARLQYMQETFAVNISSSNDELLAHSEVVILAVKPQQMPTVLSSLSGISAATTLISIAAGVTLEKLRQGLARDDLSLIRVMPNTPAFLGAGMSVMYSLADTAHRERADYIFTCVGETAWLDKEEQMNAVTALSGSGPAYFFLLTEIMQETGVAMGLPESLAGKLAAQTAFGAGRMLKETGRDAATLRDQVTSPGGTTQAALECMFDKGLADAVRAGMCAAEQRSRELD